MNPCTQESRIRTLEKENISMGSDIKHLISRMDRLTAMLEKLFYLGIPTVIALLGFLISYWVKG